MKILITGGAGFIGSNAANYFAVKGDQVIILDDLSRSGSDENIRWLRDFHKDIHVVKGDIRDFSQVRKVFHDHGEMDAVLHMASQVAVTRSVADPREDFEINALGTLNLLEAVRLHSPDAAFIYSSTNKVYGAMEGVKVIQRRKRWEYTDISKGIGEGYPLDFHSPYGCSKGCADQYVRDYKRIYGLKTAVLRQSCIYGPRQFGVEDQGWVAWFIIATVLGKGITIYGDGRQVRDVLYIDDLVNLFSIIIKNMDAASGEVYNIGGGRENTLSLIELMEILQEFEGKDIAFDTDQWRPGDQLVYISDISKIGEHLGWKPVIRPNEGVRRLYHWVLGHKEIIEKHLPPGP